MNKRLLSILPACAAIPMISTTIHLQREPRRIQAAKRTAPEIVEITPHLSTGKKDRKSFWYSEDKYTIF